MLKINKFAKIIIIFLVLISLGSLKINAADLNAKVADYSQDFINWLNLSDEEKENQMMPIPFDLPESNNSVKHFANLLTGFTQNLVRAYDSKYSLKDEIDIRVKDQQDTNECWAFSMTSILETLITKKEGELSDEYSPRHIDYSTAVDGFTDKSNKKFNRHLGDGGSYVTGIGYYASGMGPVLEEDVPFENNEKSTSSSKIQNKTVQKHVEGARIFNPIYKKISNGNISYYSNSARTNSITQTEVNATRNEIKNHILNYGGIYAIVTGVLTNDNYDINNAALYAYKESDFDASKHAITIIGWDDNYSKENFATNPKNDGAYICLNSYGEDEYDEGYIYVSYDDILIEANLCGITDYDELDYNNIYQYDELGMSSYLSYNLNDVFIYNLYSREDIGKKEFISEVGTYIVSDTKVEVYIDSTGNTTDYRSMKKAELENSGETLKYGYHVLKFKEPIELTGSKFRVVIKYSNMSDSYLTVPVERNISGSLYEYATVSGKSYASADGYNWEPLKDSLGNSFDATVKAFTYFGESPNSIKLDKTQTQIDLSSTETKIKLIETIEPANVKDNIIWSSSNEQVAIVDDGQVTAKSNGKAIITARTSNNLTASCTITVVTSPKSINLDKKNITLYINGENTYKLNTSIEPSTANYQNSLSWSSDNQEVASVDSSGNVIAKSEGTAKITVKTENSKIAECNVLVESENSFYIESDKYEIDNISKFIKFIPINTTYSEFRDNISTNVNYVIYDKDGNEIDNGIIKTGYKLVSKENNTEYLISVMFDATGDGVLNLVDIARMRLHYVGNPKYILDEIHATSLDVNKDGIFNLVDCAQIVQRYLLN